MWFKNLRLYCLTKPFDSSMDDLQAALADKPFRPCNSYERSTMGWVGPIDSNSLNAGDDKETMYSHAVGDYIMLCAKRQDRLLPASVIREAADAKIMEIEERQARKIYRKEKKQIQEDMGATLLPQAFTRSQLTHAYLSPKENLLVVNAAAPAKAEEFVSLLRDTLGTFPVGLPNSKRAPSDVMTRWLKNHKASNNFEISEDCELFNPLDGSNVVRCKGQDLSSDEITAHIDAGKQAKNLGVLWNNILSCNIGDDLSIKRLRFEEMKEENPSFTEESEAQKFDQEFALMTLELSSFFDSLFAAFGGLDDPRKMVKVDDSES